MLRREVHRLREALRELRLLQLEPHAAAGRGPERVGGHAVGRDEHAVRAGLALLEANVGELGVGRDGRGRVASGSLDVGRAGGAGHGGRRQRHLQRRAFGANAVGGLLQQAHREAGHRPRVGLEALREHAADQADLRRERLFHAGDDVRVRDVDEQSLAPALDAYVEDRSCRYRRLRSRLRPWKRRLPGPSRRERGSARPRAPSAQLRVADSTTA